MAHIKNTYHLDGSRTSEPQGFGGELCHKATKPYEARQGATEKVATEEALAPSYLEVNKTEQKESQ